MRICTHNGLYLFGLLICTCCVGQKVVSLPKVCIKGSEGHGNYFSPQKDPILFSLDESV